LLALLLLLLVNRAALTNSSGFAAMLDDAEAVLQEHMETAKLTTAIKLQGYGI
jgi:hypothetical protein